MSKLRTHAGNRELFLYPPLEKHPGLFENQDRTPSSLIFKSKDFFQRGPFFGELLTKN